MPPSKTSAVKKISWKLAKYFLFLHLGTQTAYCGNEFLHTISPSTVRIAFEKTAGFPITGWRSDIEDNPQGILAAVYALEKEQADGLHQLSSLRVESGHYFKKNILEQLAALVTSGHGGYYIPTLEQIVINSGLDPETIHHEIKHAKTFKVLENHPEFKTEWNQLAVNGEGTSLYASALERIFSWIKTRNPKAPVEQARLEEQGFVSSYAQLNLLEDIAEIGELAETSPEFSRIELWTQNPDRYSKIISKFKLAEKYGLISSGFLEYVALSQKYREADPEGKISDENKADHFLEESRQFLEKYPFSSYSLPLRLARGNILVAKAHILVARAQNSRENIYEAITEYKLGLTAGYKTPEDYPAILRRLRSIHETITLDAFCSRVYKEAELEFWTRYHAHDLTLPNKGVNDLLEWYGEL